MNLVVHLEEDQFSSISLEGSFIECLFINTNIVAVHFVFSHVCSKYSFLLCMFLFPYVTFKPNHLLMCFEITCFG
jgi:hypothetical protein